MKLTSKILVLSGLGALAVFLFLSYLTMDKQNHAIPILEYHNVSSEPADMEPWTVSTNDFNEQMAYLSQNCRVVPLKTLLNDLNEGKTVADNTVAITFDDGYFSNYNLAYPILQQYGLPATMFVVGKTTENVGGNQHKKYMSWKELKTMNASGLIDIESHSFNLHYLAPNGKDGKLEPGALRQTSPEGSETYEDYFNRIKSDLINSSQCIEANLGYKPVILSWPYGICDKNVLGVVQETGFIYMIDMVGYTNPKSDLQHINRMVVGGMDMKSFKNIVNPPKISFRESMGLQFKRIKSRLLL